MTWEEALRQFQEYLLAKGYAERTAQEYLRDLRSCVRFLSESKISVGSVNREDLLRYDTHLCTRKPAFAPSTIIKKLAALRLFFGFLTKERVLLFDPSRNLPTPRMVSGLPRGILSLREVNRLLAASDVSSPFGLRNRAILELLYSSGLRNSELRTLELPDLDLERLEARVLGKGAKVRIVPIGEQAAYWIDRYLTSVRPLWAREETAVFLAPDGRRMTRGMVSDWVSRTAKRAGIKKPFSAHGLRHTCATHLLRGKADLRSIQELLGHKLLSTTQRYTKVEISDLKRIHARCHPRARRR